MTNKEIIIDGCDVSGCEFLRNCIIPDNYGCKIDDSLCCDVGDCYYKQLKRKEQECERLDNEAQNLFTEKTNLEIELRQLKAENEKQKEFQKLLEEQMEFNRNELELALSSGIKRSDFLLKEFQKVDKQRDNWREQAEKYSRTLQEIKAFLEYEFYGENIWVKEKILQKISEVEEQC